MWSPQKSLFRVGFLLGIAVLLFGNGTMAQVPLEEEVYPGGTLRLVYANYFFNEEEDILQLENQYFFDLVPVEGTDDLYEMSLAIKYRIQSGEELYPSESTSSSAAGVAGDRYEIETGTITLSPLSVLDTREVEIEPNQTYYLPDGARLVTGERDQIAGVDVVHGVFTHPAYPNQRAVVAMIPSAQVRRYIILKPLQTIEKDGKEISRSELIEFSYIPPGGEDND